MKENIKCPLKMKFTNEQIEDILNLKSNFEDIQKRESELVEEISKNLDKEKLQKIFNIKNNDK